MKNLGLLLGSLVVTFLAVVGIALLISRQTNAPVEASDSSLVIGQARNTKGKADAKVVISEFSDLQCPACKAVQPLLQDIENRYGENVRFVYRHFPLRNIHPNAFVAAKASEAAANQGKFWQFHDVLFAKQDEWEEETDPKGKFESYAQELSLDLEKFKSDYASASVEERITTDERDAVTLGVDSTPTFYVNNYKTSVDQLDAAIQRELSAQ